MAERMLERRKEPEPGELIYDYIFNFRLKRRLQTMQGKVVIKGQDVPWEQSRQGLIKFYIHPKVWDEMGVPNWSMFIHRIRKHSGRHRHQGGLGLFVLEGRGYTVVDSVRYDWEKDDLILLPIKPEGCEHQHFNVDPDKPSEWLAFSFYPFTDAMGNDLEQKAISPDWQGDASLTPRPHIG